MALTFQIEIQGATELTARINKVASDIADLSDVFPAVRPVFFAIERENFASDNATGKSGTWAPLSPADEKAKAREYGTLSFVGGIMVASGKLKESLTGQTDDTVADIQPLEASFGTSLPYAKFNQDGNSSRNLPQRPTIDFSESQVRRIANAFRNALLAKVGLKVKSVIPYGTPIDEGQAEQEIFL